MTGSAWREHGRGADAEPELPSGELGPGEDHGGAHATVEEAGVVGDGERGLAAVRPAGDRGLRRIDQPAQRAVRGRVRGGSHALGDRALGVAGRRDPRSRAGT